MVNKLFAEAHGIFIRERGEDMIMKKAQFAGMIMSVFGLMAMQQFGFNFAALTAPAIIAALVFIAGLYLFIRDL